MSKHSRQHNYQLGAQGEAQASAFLRAQGYRIEAANVRLGQQEIDLVAWDEQHQELVFVEVKTRASAAEGDPAEAVDERKLRALTRAAATYVRQQRVKTDYRLDIVAVLPDKIEHFINVTWP